MINYLSYSATTLKCREVNQWWRSFVDGEMETKIKIKKIVRRITQGHDYLRKMKKNEREEFRLCAERIIKENPEDDVESLYVLITCFHEP